MHAGALRALEFDRIVDAVRRFALTPTGAARLARLAPATDPRAVRNALAATAETVRFLDDNQIALQRAGRSGRDHRVAVRRRPCARRRPSCSRSAGSCPSVDSTAAAIRRARSAFPILRAIADAAASFEQEIADVRRKIDPAGEVVDDASPELKAVRERLRKQRARLRGTLESYLRGKDTAEVSAAADRHRPQRDAMCSSSGRNTARRFRESSTAAPAAARACFSSR